LRRDTFAGGFVVQSLLALWLFERFDMSLRAQPKTKLSDFSRL
jgi:hypothetical protein